VSEASATDIEIRAAEPADLPAISRIMNWPPEPPLAMMVGAARASRLGDILVRAGINLKIEDAFVAVVDGGVAGVMECGGRSGPGAGLGNFVPLLPQIIPALGTALPRAVRGMWLQRRVEFAPVPDAFAVVELYVDERMRGRGIGGTLLDHAETLARGRWPRMCIETGIDNPARRLYERHGFRVIETKTSAAYERLTGSPGRILMVKELVSG
jgi:ribosomal protein S18 acetylase RimI-like enzyme